MRSAGASMRAVRLTVYVGLITLCSIEVRRPPAAARSPAAPRARSGLTRRGAAIIVYGGNDGGHDAIDGNSPRGHGASACGGPPARATVGTRRSPARRRLL